MKGLTKGLIFKSLMLGVVGVAGLLIVLLVINLLTGLLEILIP